jgi:hypothetical protein
MRTGSYVNRTWYHPASSELTRNINPADTSDVIAECPLATAVEISRRRADEIARGLTVVGQAPYVKAAHYSGRADRSLTR